MKQLFKDGGFLTIDPTEGRIHRVTNDEGGIVYLACFPKRWITDGNEYAIDTTKGKLMVRNHEVIEWEEIELQFKES